MRKIDIRVASFFPFTFKMVGVACNLAAIYLAFIEPVYMAIFLPIGVILTSTHYRLTNDLTEGYFKEYTWFLGLKTGNTYPIGNYKNLVINSFKRNFEYGNVIRRYGITQTYRAFLKFEEQEESAFLGESKSLKKMEKKSAWIKQQLGIT